MRELQKTDIVPILALVRENEAGRVSPVRIAWIGEPCGLEPGGPLTIMSLEMPELLAVLGQMVVNEERLKRARLNARRDGFEAYEQARTRASEQSESIEILVDRILSLEGE